jgi:hypothetical protein
MKSFTRSDIVKLRSEIDAALAEVAKKNGIVIQAGNATFNHLTATFKVELIAQGDDGQIVDKYGASFKALHTFLGMKASDLGSEFTLNGKNFILKGYSPKSRKFPFIATNVLDGKDYKLPNDSVKKALGYN